MFKIFQGDDSDEAQAVATDAVEQPAATPAIQATEQSNESLPQVTGNILERAAILIATESLKEAESKTRIALLNEQTASRQLITARVMSAKADEELAGVQAVNRPSVRLGATITQENDKYIAAHGCIIETGESPEQAMTNFDLRWFHG